MWISSTTELLLPCTSSKHQGCCRNGRHVCEQVIPLPLPAQTLHPVLLSCPIPILCGTPCPWSSPQDHPQDPHSRTGGWTVASLIMAPYLCTSILILGQHSISNLLPVLSCGRCTGGKILHTMHPTVGNFSRSCFK